MNNDIIIPLYLNVQCSLSKIIDAAQDVFLKYHFISEENARKAEDGQVRRPEVLATAAVDPHPRCPICTLV